MSLWSRISNAVHGESLNREIEEELQSHIEEAIASGRIVTADIFGCRARSLRRHRLRIRRGALCRVAFLSGQSH